MINDHRFPVPRHDEPKSEHSIVIGSRLSSSGLRASIRGQLKLAQAALKGESAEATTETESDATVPEKNRSGSCCQRNGLMEAKIPIESVRIAEPCCRSGNARLPGNDRWDRVFQKNSADPYYYSRGRCFGPSHHSPAHAPYRIGPSVNRQSAKPNASLMMPRAIVSPLIALRGPVMY